jgi:hypothetical protein
VSRLVSLLFGRSGVSRYRAPYYGRKIMSSVRVGLAARLAGLALVCVTAAPSVPAADMGTGSAEGKVTFKGKPVAEGKLAFHPDGGKPVVADIKGGAYSAKGVPLGQFWVTVESAGVPRRYADPKTTPLRAEVKKGKNTLDFDLKN